MKIHSVEVTTDLGRRVIQLSPSIEVDPTGAMPERFRSLTTVVLWEMIQQVAFHGLALGTSAKAEA